MFLVCKVSEDCCWRSFIVTMILQRSFVLQILLNGFLEDGNPTPASTLLECTMMCMDTEGCSSFFYGKSIKLCKLAGTRYFSSVGLTSAPEYKYYMMRPDCGSEWRFISGQCYRYMGEPEDFYSAKSSCESIGGFLAITDSLKDDVIIKFILTEHGTSAWIGGTDEAVEGKWVWGNGNPIILDLWAPAEPVGLAGDNCLEQWHTAWNDEFCNNRLSYLCEK